MNSLKKALTRDDTRRYNRTIVQVSGIKKASQPADIEWMIMKKREKRSEERTIEEMFKKVVEGNFSNGQIKEVGKLCKELSQKYAQLYPEEPSPVDLHQVAELLRNMAKMEEGVIFKKYLQITCQAILSFIREREDKQKAKCLDDFNKILKNTRPNNKKDQGSIKALNKLVHSTSASNLKIRVTRDEYHFQEDQIPLRKKKSLDMKNRSKLSSQSNKNVEGNKLQQFLKETNVKLVKTKIEYDFSAIFQASNRNIQPRNKTTYIEPKTQKQLLTKASKGKRDQGFVFYRPKKRH